jgi:hypothetical protein
MKVAVILSGALRTIKKTISYLKKNVLVDPQNTDIFACVQNDTSQSEEEWDSWFSHELGQSLKSISWFSYQKYPEWLAQRENLLQAIQLDAVWKNYLRASGSMIEYFQLHIANLKMNQYEQTHRCNYDYVVRARTDSIYAKPVDFHWLHWSEEDVQKRLQKIETELELSNIPVTDENRLKYFMCTMLSDDLIPNIQNIFADRQTSDTVLSDPSTILLDLNAYLKEGRYILTIRRNNLYVIRRELFQLIPALGVNYGLMRTPHSDDYWFNAEGQFRAACYYSCITVYDYSSMFEEKSLEYADKWVEAHFFYMAFQPVNPRMLYCVVRK